METGLRSNLCSFATICHRRLSHITLCVLSISLIFGHSLLFYALKPYGIDFPGITHLSQYTLVLFSSNRKVCTFGSFLAITLDIDHLAYGHKFIDHVHWLGEDFIQDFGCFHGCTVNEDLDGNIWSHVGYPIQNRY